LAAVVSQEVGEALMILSRGKYGPLKEAGGFGELGLVGMTTFGSKAALKMSFNLSFSLVTASLYFVLSDS
jgi:hypothetical protein